MAAEVRKHEVNDLKCSELGWVSISLAVETYGWWGAEAQSTISRLASRLAIQLQCSKSMQGHLYQCLNITLIRANTRALLSRSGFFRSEGVVFQVVHMCNCIVNRLYSYDITMVLCSAAAIWSLADIAYITIYRDMSKISRYCIAIFFKYIHRAIIYQ